MMGAYMDAWASVTYERRLKIKMRGKHEAK